MRLDTRPGGEHREFLEVLGALTVAPSDEDEHRGEYEERILGWYGDGLTARAIRAALRATAGVDVSLGTIAKVGSVGDELAQWRTRPLDAVYPVIVIDALTVKIRGTSLARQAVVATGVDCDGARGVLGLWLDAGDEGRPAVLDDLRSRGVADVCVLCCHVSDGVVEVAGAVWPRAVVQPWAVRLIRASSRYARTRDRAALRTSMRQVFTAADIDGAEAAVQALIRRWEERYPAVASLWRANWRELAPMLSLPVDARRPIYQTGVVDSVHQRLRDVARTRGAFASEQDALGVLYLALRGVPELRNPGQEAPSADWKRTLQAFTVHFDGRLPLP